MSRFAEQPLAIIGMGCRLPGADNIDEFWRLLIEGRCALGELPPDRMDRELQYSPQKGIRTRSYSCMGGVAREQAFPPGEQPVSQRVIDQSHSAHITLCNVAAAACRDAGLDPYALPTRNVGVYIGHTPPSAHIGQVVYARMIGQTAQYLREIRNLDQLTRGETDRIIREIVESVRSGYQYGDRLTQMRANAHHGPGLISMAFGLDGPSVAFDAACASSFRALGHGVRALQRGTVDMALVGGASYVHGDTLVVFSQAQSVSSGTSTPFDEQAGGLIAAGGYVVLAMKTLERAIADGDPIQAVICGLGVSSDGKGKSLWAPRQEGQIEAISRAYGYGMEFNELQYLEMHATSTQVGDATELAALAKASQGKFPQGTKIPIGSVKANIGHTLETAGIASLLKTVLAMKHGQIPPQINVQNLNSNVDWEQLPFYVPTQALAWNRPAENVPRRAAVNAFGIGGLNVHIALREHIAAPAVPRRTAAPPTHQPAAASAEQDAVAIVGMGAIYPGARTIEHLWDVLREGRDQKSEVTPERWDKQLACQPGARELWKVPTATGGFIHDYQYDWKRHKVPPKQIASADPLQFMLLDAADQALRDAGYDSRPFDRKRTGVIVGIVFGGEFADQLQAGLRLTDFQKRLTAALRTRGVPDEQIEQVCAEYENVLLKHMPALIDETGSFTASTLASRITKTFDLMGGAVALDAGDCSSLSAIESCVDVLLAGDCDMMICASGQRAMGIPTFEWLARYDLLSTGEPHGPFDAQATGCVPGEGVGALILKRLSDAQRDGDRIHGIIRGVGVSRADSRREALRNAMTRSLASAGLEPQSVSVIESGSSGVPDRDRAELQAIADAYGTVARREPLRLGTVAGQMGNIGGGLGMASLIKAVSELSHVEVTPVVDVQQPISEVAQHAQLLTLPTAPSRIPPANTDGRLFAGINSYANHNLAYHVIVEGPVRVPLPELPVERAVPAARVAVSRSTGTARSGLSASWQPTWSGWRIVRFSADTAGALESQVTAAVDKAAEIFRTAGELQYGESQPLRLAIVADSAETLQARLSLAAKQLSNPAARAALAEKGVFIGERRAERPTVAFLFPGQGSQYAGMLRALTQECPAAAAALAEIEVVLQRMQLPCFADLAWNADNHLGEDVWKTQLSLLIADTLVYAAALSAGLRADRVAGHSFGELAALVAAGSWTFEDALRATSERCTAISGCRHAGGQLVSTNARAEVADQLCRQIGGKVWISHFNAPEQTVVGGETASVQKVAEALREAGYLAKVLDVPAAFHTPLMEEVKVPFGAALQHIPLGPPLIPLLSSVTNRYVADPADIRENLVQQMTKPVNYVQLTERLADEGVVALVEVGPRQVLTGLHRQILAGRDVAIVGCDHPKRGAMEQLLFARGCLEVVGAAGDVADAPLLRISQTTAAQSPVAATTAAEAEVRPAAAVSTAAEPAAAVQETAAAELPQLTEAHAAVSVLELSGTPYEIGRRQGEVYADAIRAVLRRYADLAGSSWEAAAGVEDAVAHPERYFGAAELDELRGMAAGAGVTLQGLLAHNLRLYLNSCAGGVHFALSAEGNPAGGMIHAVNEDLARALKLNQCLRRSIQLRRLSGVQPCMTFGIVGQIGSLCGINAHGLAVSTASLMDIEPEKIRLSGRLITVLIKNILEQAVDVDSAVALLRATQLAGAWTLCISHKATDRVCYVEFDGQSMRVQPQLQRAMASNHQQLMNYTRQSFATNVPAHSSNRLNRLKELLGTPGVASVTADAAKAALRDRFDAVAGQEAAAPTMHTLHRVDNQISVVMQPGAGLVWVTGGPGSNGHQNSFQPISLLGLLTPEAQPQPAPQQAAAAVGRVSSEISRDELLRAFAVADQEAARAVAPRVCSRFVMRVVPQPLPAERSAGLNLSGRAVILGDNPAAQTLQQRLQAQGVTAQLIAETDDPAAAVAALEQLWQAGPAPHLFLMTALNAEATTSLETGAWQTRRSRGVMLPYLVCQKWFQLVSSAKLLSQASLTAGTVMGGDFGFSGQVRGVEGGALTGLVKGVHLELEIGQSEKDFRARIVDFSEGTSAADVARLLCQELAAGDDEIEVGYINGRRYVVRPVAETAPQRPVGRIPRGANVIVTGGARGITAVVAREVGQKLGAKLHLIGSSPVPAVPDAFRNPSEEQRRELKALVMKEALAEGRKPIDAWEQYEKALELDQTLRSFAEAGIQATYHACDISNRAALASLLQSIRVQDGPIQGVIHGAGFERATRFDKKKPELVDRTVAVKVDGAANLMALTADDPVQFFAAFGSVSGRFGGVGQTDYCVANDMLAKLVDWYRSTRPQTGATTFHWHAWDDVGMAMRPESKHIRQLHDITFMPSREGSAHLLDELQLCLPESEIVVTELKTCRERFGTAADAAAPVVSEAPAAFPLIDGIVSETPGCELVAELKLDPQQDVFLKQHLFKGKPLLPVVVAMESLVEAAVRLTGRQGQVAALQNIEIINGLRFTSDESQTARVRAVADGDVVSCELMCDFVNRRGVVIQPDRPYLRANVVLADKPAAASTCAAPPDAEWHDVWYPEEDTVIYHGPVFRYLRQITVDERSDGWARLTAPPLADVAGARGGAGWVMPSALLDGCFFACGAFLWFLFEGVVAIPAGIQEIRFGRAPRPGEQCLAHIWFRDRKDDQGIFDVFLYGENGDAILEVDGYRNIIVAQAISHVS